MKPKKRKPRKRQAIVAELLKVKLTDNTQCLSNFYDYAWDQAGQTFEDAVRTHRGHNGFRGEKNGAACRQQCLDEWNKMRDEVIDIARAMEQSGEKDEMFGAKYAAIPRPMRKSNEIL